MIVCIGEGADVVNGKPKWKPVIFTTADRDFNIIRELGVINFI